MGRALFAKPIVYYVSNKDLDDIKDFIIKDDVKEASKDCSLLFIPNDFRNRTIWNKKFNLRIICVNNTA